MKPRAWGTEAGLVSMAVGKEVREDREAGLEGLDQGQTLPEACGPALQHGHTEMAYTLFLEDLNGD